MQSWEYATYVNKHMEARYKKLGLRMVTSDSQRSGASRCQCNSAEAADRQQHMEKRYEKRALCSMQHAVLQVKSNHLFSGLQFHHG